MRSFLRKSTPWSTLVLAALTTATALTVAHADSTSGTSKEDTNLEAQGNVTGVFLRHGAGTVEYRTRFQSSGATGSVGLKVESSLFGPFDSEETGFDGVTLAPVKFEVKASIELDKNTVVFAPERVRADAVQFLIPAAGVSVKFLGYDYESYTSKKIGMNAIHVGAITINEAINLDGGDGSAVSLILKGEASISLGTGDVAQNLPDSYRLGWESALHKTTQTKDGPHSYYSGTFPNEVSGSIGVRIMNNVLVELFGDLNQLSANNLFVRETSIGGKARAMLFDKKLQITTSVAKQTASFMSRGDTITEDDGILLMVGVEGHW